MSESPPSSPPTRAAPPIHRMPVMEEPPPTKWPTVIGVLCIVVASSYLVCTSIGELVNIVAADLAPTSDVVTYGMVLPEPWNWVNFGFWLLYGASLLAIGIGMLKRRRWSARAVPPWAILTALYEIISTLAMQKYMRRVMLAAMQEDPNFANVNAGYVDAAMGMGLVFGLCLNLTPSVFLLIWMLRPKIRAETAEWR